MKHNSQEELFVNNGGAINTNRLSMCISDSGSNIDVPLPTSSAFTTTSAPTSVSIVTSATITVTCTSTVAQSWKLKMRQLGDDVSIAKTVSAVLIMIQKIMVK